MSLNSAMIKILRSLKILEGQASSTIESFESENQDSSPIESFVSENHQEQQIPVPAKNETKRGSSQKPPKKASPTRKLTKAERNQLRNATIKARKERKKERKEQNRQSSQGYWQARMIKQAEASPEVQEFAEKVRVMSSSEREQAWHNLSLEEWGLCDNFSSFVDENLDGTRSELAIIQAKRNVLSRYI